MSVSAAVLAKLAKFDTPTICSPTELFDVRPRNTGYVDARIIAAFPETLPMTDIAATAIILVFAPPRAGNAH